MAVGVTVLPAGSASATQFCGWLAVGRVWPGVALAVAAPLASSSPATEIIKTRRCFIYSSGPSNRWSPLSS